MQRRRSMGIGAFIALVVMASMLSPATTKPAAADGFGTTTVWSNRFVQSGLTVRLGDVNGDQRDDLVGFVRSSRAEPERGDVYVALSDGKGSFNPRQLWHSHFSLGREVPHVGDVDGDGFDDIITFTQDDRPEPGRGDVWVAISNGFDGFGAGQKWHDHLSLGGETPAVGDFDGDGRDDIATFVQDARPDPGRGDVWVALAKPEGGFETGRLWSGFFAPGREKPAVGDVDGDGADDIVTFIQDTKTAFGRADVMVSVSDGSGAFKSPTLWHEQFSVGGETPQVADLDGDGRADAVTFVGASQSGQRRGDVYAAYSQPLADAPGAFVGDDLLWHESFAWNGGVILMGDVNGDGKTDAVNVQGNVSVALAGAPTAKAAFTPTFGFGSMTVDGRRAIGERPLLAILIEFSDSEFRPDRRQPYWDRQFFSGTRNAADHFEEMSQGRFRWVRAGAGVVGPFKPANNPRTPRDESSLACAMNLTDSNGNQLCPGSTGSTNFIRSEAIRLAARSGFRFPSFDRNRNGIVGPTELTIHVVDGSTTGGAAAEPVDCLKPWAARWDLKVCPGKVPGQNQHASNSDQLDYFYIAHELTHTLGARDVYGWNNHGRRMSLNGPTLVPTRPYMHMDPWHKIQLGWVTPRVWPIRSSGSCQYFEGAHWSGTGGFGTRAPVVIYDPNVGTHEFTILEYRSNSDFYSFANTYDDDVDADGLVIWQVEVGRDLVHTRVDGIDYRYYLPVDILGGIEAGPDGVLQSAADGDDQLEDNSGDGVMDEINPGNDRIMQSTFASGDIFQKDKVMLPYGPSGGLAGGSGGWANSHGEITLKSFPERDATILRLDVGGLNLNRGLPVKWTMHGFRTEVAPDLMNDPDVADCYEEFLPR